MLNELKPKAQSEFSTATQLELRREPAPRNAIRGSPTVENNEKHCMISPSGEVCQRLLDSNMSEGDDAA